MDIVWRAILKKYSKVREPFDAVSEVMFLNWIARLKEKLSGFIHD